MSWQIFLFIYWYLIYYTVRECHLRDILEFKLGMFDNKQRRILNGKSS